MAQWHVVIPFYFGVNRYVTGIGGAQVSKKISFLTKTIESITRVISGVDIAVTVCDSTSEKAAKTVVGTVLRIDCPPLHLPYATVKCAAHHLRRSWANDDIVLFNEDDQVLYMDSKVREDIECHGIDYFFSPHRWVRGGKEWRFRTAPRYRLENHSGIIDNVYKGDKGSFYSFNCTYCSQHSKLSAYAACWATRSISLRYLDFRPYETEPHTICLETASYLVLDTSLPVLKLDLASEPAEYFLVDHLSGQHSFTHRLSLRRLVSHVRRMKF